MGHGKDIAERAQKIRDPVFLEAVVGRCSGISYTYREQAQPPSVAERPRRRRPRARRRSRPRPHVVRLDAPSVVHVARAAGARERAGGAASEPRRRSCIVSPPCSSCASSRRTPQVRGTLWRERRRPAAAVAARRLRRLPRQSQRSSTRSRRACTSGSRFEVLRLGAAAAALTAARRADIVGAVVGWAHRKLPAWTSSISWAASTFSSCICRSASSSRCACSRS